MTRDRPSLSPRWLWLGTNALWIVVPVIALLVSGVGTTSDTDFLLWQGPFVGLCIFLVRYAQWQERRNETSAERASREAAKEPETWLRLGRNALWIVVPLIPLLVSMWTTSEFAHNLLLIPTLVGVGVIMFKFLEWGKKLWSMRVDSAGTTLGESILVVLAVLVTWAVGFGVVYVVVHFVVKYW